jgi:hypothetical protein
MSESAVADEIIAENDVMEKSADAVKFDTAAIELQEYRRLVSETAKASTGEVIFNQDLDRAAIIIEYIFRESKNEVDIVTWGLLERIFGAQKLVEAATTFLTQNEHPRLNIISAEEVSSTHPLLSALKEPKFSNRVDLRVMTPEMKRDVKYHFTVGDSRCFRFERHPRPGDICDAVVQFGEEDIGRKLSNKFHQLQTQLGPTEK